MNGIDRIRDFLATVFDTNHSKIENPGNSDQKPPYAVPSTEQDNPSDVAFSHQESDGTASAEKDTHDNPTEQEQLVAEPPKYPTKEDGTPDYDNMTPQQEYDYVVENYGEETAQKVAQSYIKRCQNAISNIQAQLDDGEVIGSRAALLCQLRDNRQRLEAWCAFLKEPQQQTPAAEQQQAQPAPDQPKSPPKKDDTFNYYKMSPQQEYEYTVKKYGEEIAQKDVQAYIESYQYIINRLQTKFGREVVCHTHSNIRLREDRQLLEAWRALLKEPQQVPAAESQQQEQQQQEVAEQQPAPKQPKYPTKEDGTPDYDNMTPQQEYDYMAETFGEKTAQEQAQAYVDSYQDAVRNIQAQLNNKKVIRSRAAMLDQLKENKPLLEAWRALLKEQPPATETQQKSPIPDCPTALSERFKHPRILFYASRIQQWRNDIQNATSDSERDMLQIKLHYRTRWWKRSILDLICDPILSAEYDSVVDSLDWDDLTEAEQWQAEVREATLSVMRKKEKGEMYKHAMNLLRNTESSDLERLVAETVIEAIEQDEKESYENDILPRLKKLDGVSDITMNSGISVRPSRKGEIMELVHVVEASVPAEAETDFLCEMETAADILMPDRFSISLEETVKTSDNQKKVKTTQLDPNFNELRYFMDEGATIRFAFDAETKNTIRFKELIDGDSDIPKMGTIYINKSLLQEIGYDPNYWLYVTLQHYVI